MPIAVMAQRTLTGRILDVNNDQPLVGATLHWKNTTAGATSTADTLELSRHAESVSFPCHTILLLTQNHFIAFGKGLFNSRFDLF